MIVNLVFQRKPEQAAESPSESMKKVRFTSEQPEARNENVSKYLQIFGRLFEGFCRYWSFPKHF